MKAKEIKELSDKDLQERLDATVKDLGRKKIDNTVSPLENPSILKDLRKDIARMKTEITARKSSNK